MNQTAGLDQLKQYNLITYILYIAGFLSVLRQLLPLS